MSEPKESAARNVAAPTIDGLLERVRAHHAVVDETLIRRAYEFAREKRGAEGRAAGALAMTHPLAVAQIVAELRADDVCIVAALLHNTPGEARQVIDEIRAEFGETIASIVDALSALSHVAFKSVQHSQAESFRKMLVAMARDIRVLLVKLADRVHTMQTLHALEPARRTALAQETRDIYAPLANRLGIAWLKTQLEDLAFRHLEPGAYQELVDLVVKKRRARDQYTGRVEKELRKALSSLNSEKLVVEGRAKHFYSIYRKLQRQGIEFDQLFDLIAFRAIVDSVPQCYEALGIVHTIWKPVPGRFKDYIALPKANGYRSLHTAVIGPYGEKMEIQIRTHEMHRIAEQGIAAHWKYKESHAALRDRDQKHFEWLKQLVQVQQELSDPGEFLDSVKGELFPDEVYIFTPKGDLKVLPRGSTPVDFAYSIHTEVGHRCVGARVNGRMVPLHTELHNGDRVEVMTGARGKPNRDWLKFAKSGSARNKIRAHLRHEQREISREIGRGLLDKELRRHGRSLDKLIKSGDLGRAARELKCQGVDDLYAWVGFRKVQPETVVDLVIPRETPPEARGDEAEAEAPPPAPSRAAVSPVRIGGIDQLLVRFAKCCKPLPGDEVVGYVSRGRGLTVHLKKCPVALSQPEERLLEVEWDAEARGQQFAVRVRVTSHDQRGALVALTDVIARHGVNITQAICKSSGDGRAIHTFGFTVSDADQLREVIAALARTKGVYGVKRLRD